MPYEENQPLEAEIIVRNFVEDVWNQGTLDRIDDLVHPRYTVSGKIVGTEWVRRNAENYRTAFPDVQVTVVDIVVMRNRVAARLLLAGTHLAEHRGIAATGCKVSYEEAAFWHIEDDKLKEGWFIADALGLRIQLGILPEDYWHNPEIAPTASE